MTIRFTIEIQLQETGLPWDGKLSEFSQIILNDYAVQRGIAKLSQQLM